MKRKTKKAGHQMKSEPAKQTNTDQSTQNQDDWKSNPYRKALREAMFLEFVQLFIELNVESVRITGKQACSEARTLEVAEHYTGRMFERMDLAHERAAGK